MDKTELSRLTSLHITSLIGNFLEPPVARGIPGTVYLIPAMPRSRNGSCFAKPAYYGETRAGRWVSALRFEFKRNPQGRLPLDEPKQDPGRPPLALDDLKPTRPRSARSKPTPQPATRSLTWTPAAPDHLEPPKLRHPPPVCDDVKARLGRDKMPTDSGIDEYAEKKWVTTDSRHHHAGRFF